MAWLRGGNTFMLRYALLRSGADDLFRELLAADALVYLGTAPGRAFFRRACGDLSWCGSADRRAGLTCYPLTGTTWRGDFSATKAVKKAR